MLPGVGVFGTGSTARVLVPLLRGEGFEVRALWGRSEEEARSLAQELGIPFHTSQSDDVLLHPDVDLVCIYISPPLTRQIAVKALGKTTQIHACMHARLYTHTVGFYGVQPHPGSVADWGSFLPLPCRRVWVISVTIPVFTPQTLAQCLHNTQQTHKILLLCFHSTQVIDEAVGKQCFHKLT